MARTKLFMTIVISLTLCAFGQLYSPATAQLAQGLLGGFLFNDALRAGDAMRAYYNDHHHFPQTTIALDKNLVDVYTALAGSPPDPSLQITSVGEYRCLGNIRMTIDQSIRDAPIEQWKANQPDNWTAPANSIVILADGQSQFLIWCAAINGVPVRDSNYQCLFVHANLAPPAGQQ